MVAGYLGRLLSGARPPIRVAVSGHRLDQLPEDALPRVRAAVTAALDSITAAGAEVGGKVARFVMISALAEGADRLCAEAALARGWALEAPLPFSIERYEKDFSSAASIDEFHRLLKRADKVRPAPQHDANAEAGYAAVAKALVGSQPDLAVIVWNGEEARGAGGTANVGAAMLDAGAPVIWIGVAERQRTKLILPAADRERSGARGRYLRGALAARFERAERPVALNGAA